MKIRLLEDTTQGTRGDVLDLDDEVAIDLERHGRAEFVGAAVPAEPSEEEHQESAPHKEKAHAAAKGKKK